MYAAISQAVAGHSVSVETAVSGAHSRRHVVRGRINWKMSGSARRNAAAPGVAIKP
jgi:hypothetical protein